MQTMKVFITYDVMNDAGNKVDTRTYSEANVSEFALIDFVTEVLRYLRNDYAKNSNFSLVVNSIVAVTI